jgi:multidrug efflux pump subunit AcrA (membrane-fusion protein)
MTDMDVNEHRMSEHNAGPGQGLQKRKVPVWRVLLSFAGLILALFLMFLYGYRKVLENRRMVESAAKSVEAGIPVVMAERVRQAATNVELTLPGNIAPITEAYIYARASGYVKSRKADIGDNVKAGELLAEIEAPELDQQVQQARATLAQSEQQLEQAKADLGEAKARQELARLTWDRYKVLVEHGAVSKQDGDQQFTVLKSTSATVSSIEARIGSAQQNVQAIRANLDRLLTLQEYEKVRAPFKGVITARNFDVGALISAAGASMGQTGAAGIAAAGAQGGELFRIAQIDRVRVLITVPESSAPSIKLGQNATVSAPAIASRGFPGKVVRTASAVDYSSRTMLTEIHVQNPERALLPGMYVQVTVVNVRSNPPLLISGDTVMTSAKGLRVAVLQDPGDKGIPAGVPGDARRVHLQPIQVGRDYGTEIEVLGGLNGSELIVKNPGDEIEEGILVQPTVRAAPGGPGGPPNRVSPPAGAR